MNLTTRPRKPRKFITIGAFDQFIYRRTSVDVASACDRRLIVSRCSAPGFLSDRLTRYAGRDFTWLRGANCQDRKCDIPDFDLLTTVGMSHIRTLSNFGTSPAHHWPSPSRHHRCTRQDTINTRSKSTSDQVQVSQTHQEEVGQFHDTDFTSTFAT